MLGYSSFGGEVQWEAESSSENAWDGISNSEGTNIEKYLEHK